MSMCLPEATPILADGFFLLPPEKRLAWRNELAWHVLSTLKVAEGRCLSDWKKQEQLLPMNLLIEGLLEQGCQDVEAMVQYVASKTMTTEYNHARYP